MNYHIFVCENRLPVEQNQSSVISTPARIAMVTDSQDYVDMMVPS